MNLETTTPVCQVVMEMMKRNLQCDDWKAQAQWAAKKEWGMDTVVEFNSDHCLVKNLKSGRTQKITLEEN